MPRKRTSAKEYANKLKELRKVCKRDTFAGFRGRRLTPHQKAKITRYHRKLNGGSYTNRQGEQILVPGLFKGGREALARPRNERERKAAIRAGAGGKGYPGFKVLGLVGNADESVRFTDRGVETFNEHRATEFKPFDDKDRLLTDTRNYLWELADEHVDEYGRLPEGSWISIRVGAYEYGTGAAGLTHGFGHEDMETLLEDLMGQFLSGTKYGGGDNAAKFLTGITIVTPN